jgi:hypothetical protein
MKTNLRLSSPEQTFSSLQIEIESLKRIFNGEMFGCRARRYVFSACLKFRALVEEDA